MCTRSGCVTMLPTACSTTWEPMLSGRDLPATACLARAWHSSRTGAPGKASTLTFTLAEALDRLGPGAGTSAASSRGRFTPPSLSAPSCLPPSSTSAALAAGAAVCTAGAAALACGKVCKVAGKPTLRMGSTTRAVWASASPAKRSPAGTSVPCRVKLGGVSPASPPSSTPGVVPPTGCASCSMTAHRDTVCPVEASRNAQLSRRRMGRPRRRAGTGTCVPPALEPSVAGVACHDTSGDSATTPSICASLRGGVPSPLLPMQAMVLGSASASPGCHPRMPASSAATSAGQSSCPSVPGAKTCRGCRAMAAGTKPLPRDSTWLESTRGFPFRATTDPAMAARSGAVFVPRAFRSRLIVVAATLGLPRFDARARVPRPPASLPLPLLEAGRLVA